VAAEPFRDRYEPLLARSPEVAAARVLRLPAQVPPWTDTGIEVASGEEISLLAAGRIVLSEALDLSAGPRLYLWGRIGPRGAIFNPTGDTTTIRAEESGRLYLGIYAGEWANRQGDLATPLEAYAALGGGIDVAAIRWRGPAAHGLAALHAAVPADPLLAAECARLAAPVEAPSGWEYHWLLGRADVFQRARVDGRSAIALRAVDDVGILRRAIEVPLAEDTILRWSWRVARLPSERAEDALPSHDYLSIALEFDDGKDLTWYWSAALPPETAFACPLPHWNARETHLVVRSGRAGLGRWQREERRVLADQQRAIGGRAPARIAAVWLIAVSLFGHGVAEAAFADIELACAGARVRVE